jgi:hypothetical protein
MHSRRGLHERLLKLGWDIERDVDLVGRACLRQSHGKDHHVLVLVELAKGKAIEKIGWNRRAEVLCSGGQCVELMGWE